MNREAFDEIIARSGYRRDYIAARIGISKSVFAQKCSGLIQWKLKEMQIMRELLDISPEEMFSIFFNDKLTKD